MIQRPTTRRARLTVSFVSSEERSCGLSVCVDMQKMELRYWWEHGNVNLNSRLRLQFLLTNLSCSRRALQQNKAQSMLYLSKKLTLFMNSKSVYRTKHHVKKILNNTLNTTLVTEMPKVISFLKLIRV